MDELDELRSYSIGPAKASQKILDGNDREATPRDS